MYFGFITIPSSSLVPMNGSTWDHKTVKYKNINAYKERIAAAWANKLTKFTTKLPGETNEENFVGELIA